MGRGKAKANREKAAQEILKAHEERKKKEAEEKEKEKKTDPKQVINVLFGEEATTQKKEKTKHKSLGDLLK